MFTFILSICWMFYFLPILCIPMSLFIIQMSFPMFFLETMLTHQNRVTANCDLPLWLFFLIPLSHFFYSNRSSSRQCDDKILVMMHCSRLRRKRGPLNIIAYDEIGWRCYSSAATYTGLCIQIQGTISSPAIQIINENLNLNAIVTW